MVVGRSAEGMRILPGNPDESVLYLAFMQDTTKHPDLKPMPFVGVEVIDQMAAMRLRAWIDVATPSITSGGSMMRAVKSSLVLFAVLATPFGLSSCSPPPDSGTGGTGGTSSAGGSGGRGGSAGRGGAGGTSATGGSSAGSGGTGVSTRRYPGHRW